MTVELICEHCHEPFQGRPNRKTCSVRCRRILENKRRFWDSRFTHVRFLEINANWESQSADVRANYKRQADELKQKLLLHYGPRP
jgi:predicted nucleic acid-binding Zn ribbon protein